MCRNGAISMRRGSRYCLASSYKLPKIDKLLTDMMRSYAFTTQGRLYIKNLEPFLMPTLLADTNLFLWIDMDNPTTEEIKCVLEDIFHFHPLSIEDCTQVSPSPKLDEYVPKMGEDRFNPYLFVVLHAVDYSRKDGVFDTSEMNFFIGKNFVVTFHYVTLKAIQEIAEKCEQTKKLIARTPDHLAHTLMDAIVDHYEPAVDELAEEVSDLETEVFSNEDTPEILNQIIKSKKEVAHLKQIIQPQRDVIGRLGRGDLRLIKPSLLPYYRDVYDHLNDIHSRASGYTETLTSMLQVYLSLSSNRTSEIIKVLTLFTILTTPTILVGGWYGMNIDFPEVGVGKTSSIYWVWGVNLIMTLIIFLYIKKKKWF